jgi:MATE family multidrug resistance protein
MTGQMIAAWWLLQRDPYYERFALRGWLGAPQRASLVELLRLGVPMGLSILIEITGFTFMTFFISRVGAIPVAGHQIAVNLVAMLYMMPLAIANAAMTLVAQRVGAADAADARRLGRHSLGLAVLIAALMGSCVYLLRRPILGLYTDDAVIIAAALPLLSWVALFHVADAAQTVGAFVLRAYRIVTVPLAVNVVAIWGVGLGGGYLLAFGALGWNPLRGATGFWSAATLGLYCAAFAFTAFLLWMFRQQRHEEHALAAA